MEYRLAADDKDKSAPFKAGPPESYPKHQTISNITIAAVPYSTEQEAKSAFGKVNPNDYGVLPVLLVVKNGSDKAVKLDEILPEYVGADRSRIEPTPARELPYIKGPKRPSNIPNPLPKFGSKKHPLAAIEIESRAFAARMLPPGETASGFVYYQTHYRDGSMVYLTGLKEAATGKELFYFELPLERQ